MVVIFFSTIDIEPSTISKYHTQQFSNPSLQRRLRERHLDLKIDRGPKANYIIPKVLIVVYTY